VSYEHIAATSSSSGSVDLEDPITLEVLWGGLVAIVSEISTTLRRTAFSSILRETNDYCVVLLDREGRLVAQNDTAPSFLYTLSVTTRHALQRWPADEWAPGDVVITNDPWIATGHVNDLTVITPCYRNGKLIGFVGSIAHAADIGGIMWSGEAADVFEEGLFLPLLKLREKGQDVKPIWEILGANVRTPDLVFGDLRAQILANEFGAHRLGEFLDGHGVADYGVLTATIQRRSEQALRQKIETLADGTYHHTVTLDGLDDPITIRAAVAIRGSDIFVDYAGSSAQVAYGVNCVLNYTTAYTVFALQCILFPDLPCNDGCFRPLHVTAPEGCILNPRPPAAVGARHNTGHHVHGALFGALAPVMPYGVMAVCPTGYCVVLAGPHERTGRFSTVTFIAGGWGARASSPGHPALSFPPNAANTPLELLEHEAPIAFMEKRLRPGTGGAGAQRGGDGQRVVFRVVGASPIRMSTITQRVDHPAEGVLGGEPGATGAITINGEPVRPQGVNTLHPGDVVEILTGGGGGFGRA
jgi:N-methylhydantoinase B